MSHEHESKTDATFAVRGAIPCGGIFKIISHAREFFHVTAPHGRIFDIDVPVREPFLLLLFCCKVLQYHYTR